MFVVALLFMGSSAFAQEREEAMVMSLGDYSSGRFSSSFFSISGIPNMKRGKDEPGGGRTWSGYNYFSINYKLDSDRKISFKLPFTYQSEGWNEYQEYTSQRADLQDVFFAMNFYDLGYIGPVDLAGAVKLYLPTGQFSQDSGLITRLRGELYATWNFSRFSSLNYVIKPDYYLQTRTAYFNESTPTFDDGGYIIDPRSTTKQYELEHYLELVADLNRYFALKPKAGFDESWRYGSIANELESAHITKAVFGIGLEIRPIRRLNLTLGMQNETVLNSYRGNDIAFFQPENTSYTLMTNLFLFNL